jgi:hypothetical protein
MIAIGLAIGLSGCATAQLESAGALSSYDGMVAADGISTRSKLRVDKAAVLQAQTVSIVPSSYANVPTDGLSDKQRRVIANAIDRSLCIGLSDKFVVVPPGQPADLTAHVTITRVTVTDATVAGISKAASIAPMFISAGFPVIVPRIPYGLGALAVEAEAKDAGGQQRAALVWARGADMLTSKPRVAASGDAYDLASEFGADFSRLLAYGENPMTPRLTLLTSQRIQSSFGGKPKYAACDAFGRIGLPAIVGAQLGQPPEWNDDATPVAQ